MTRNLDRNPHPESSERAWSRRNIFGLLTAIAFSLMATTVHAGDASLPKDDPVSIVTALFKLDANGHGDAVFPRSAATLGIDYLTPALRAAWKTAIRRSPTPLR